MPNLTGPTALVIILIVLLLFGAPKLPALARSLGQSMKILKKEVTSNDEQTPADADAPEAATGQAASAAASAVSTTDADELARAKAEAEAAKAEADALRAAAKQRETDEQA